MHITWTRRLAALAVSLSFGLALPAHAELFGWWSHGSEDNAARDREAHQRAQLSPEVQEQLDSIDKFISRREHEIEEGANRIAGFQNAIRDARATAVDGGFWLGETALAAYYANKFFKKERPASLSKHKVENIMVRANDGSDKLVPLQELLPHLKKGEKIVAQELNHWSRAERIGGVSAAGYTGYQSFNRFFFPIREIVKLQKDIESEKAYLTESYAELLTKKAERARILDGREVSTLSPEQQLQYPKTTAVLSKIKTIDDDIARKQAQLTYSQADYEAVRRQVETSPALDYSGVAMNGAGIGVNIAAKRFLKNRYPVVLGGMRGRALDLVSRGVTAGLAGRALVSAVEGGFDTAERNVLAKRLPLRKKQIDVASAKLDQRRKERAAVLEELKQARLDERVR